MPGLAFRDINYGEREEGEIGAEVACSFNDKLVCAQCSVSARVLFHHNKNGIWVLLRRRRRFLYVCEEVGPHLVTSEPSKGGLMTTDALQQINQKV